MKEKPRVLFFCAKNSARSQIAEALLRRYAGDRFESCSAGLGAGEIHPLTRKVLREVGIGGEQLKAKNVRAFLGRASVHCAILLCDKAQSNCPRLFPFALRTLHWPFSDPATIGETEAEKLEAFRGVRDELTSRITSWLAEELQPV